MEPFKYSEVFNLFICSSCQQAVTGSRIKRHLSEFSHRQQGHNTDQWRQRIERWCQEQGVRPAGNFEEVRFPSRAIKAVEGLSIFTDGFACENCHYMAGSRRDIQIHLRDMNQWQNPEGKGRRRRKQRPQQGPWREGVCYQQLVSKSVYGRLFEVIQPEQASEEQQSRMTRRAGTSEADWQRRMMEDEARSSAMLRQLSDETRARVEASQKTEVNVWLDRNGWAEYLQGKDRPSLMKLLQPAGQEDESQDDEDYEEEEGQKEAVLQEIEARFRKIIAVAQNTTIRGASHFVRFAINRKDSHKEPTKPFNARMEDSTMKRYQEVFLQLIRFVVRTWDIPPPIVTPAPARAADSGYFSSLSLPLSSTPSRRVNSIRELGGNPDEETMSAEESSNPLSSEGDNPLASGVATR